MIYTAPMGASVAQQESVRWWRWVRGRRVSCPVGHVIPVRAEINDTGFIRCDHRSRDGVGECGRWVFLLAVRGGGAIVAEVALDEKAKMRQLSTPSEMLEYLNIFPGSPHE